MNFLSSHKRIISQVLLGLILAFFTCLFFSYATSPLFLYPSNSALVDDSNFFIYYASLLLQGKTPYIDFFDHKGLYHIFVIAFGYLLGEMTGLFLWEVLLNFVNFFLLARMIEAFAKDTQTKNIGIAMSWATLVLLRILMFNGGVHEGELLLPWTTLSLYFFVKGYTEKKNIWISLAVVIAGVEAGCAFMSRPLDALAGLSLCFGYFFCFLKEKKPIKELVFNVVFAVISFFIPISLFSFIALGGGYSSYMWNAILSSNAGYLTSGFQDELDWVRFFLCILMGILFSFISYLFFLVQKKKGNLSVAYFLVATSIFYYFLMGFLLRSSHYFWSFLSVSSFSLSYTVISLEKKQNVPFRYVSLGLYASFFLLFVVSECQYWASDTSSSWFGLSSRQESLIRHDLNLIPERAYEESEVYVINFDSSLYLMKDFYTTNPYPHFQSWWASFSPEIKDDINEFLLGDDRPIFLIVGEVDKAETYFGEAINTHYVPYEEDRQTYEDFRLYYDSVLAEDFFLEE